MYETHTHPGFALAGEPDKVYAVHEDLRDALAEADRIADRVEAQLAANGEGHRGFWVHLAIRDTATGTDVAYSGFGLAPRPAAAERQPSADRSPADGERCWRDADVRGVS